MLNSNQWFDFTVHLIISKFFWGQKCREVKKNGTKRCRRDRQNYLQKCFHSSKYTIDHANVCFFFFIFLQAFAHSLNNVNSLHCFMWFMLLVASFQFRSFHCFHIYSHTNCLFEFMNFLNIIHKGESFVLGAWQIAHTVTGVHTTCKQRGFYVHEITCT